MANKVAISIFTQNTQASSIFVAHKEIQIFFITKRGMWMEPKNYQWTVMSKWI